ncbi:HAD-superfamily hydrolase, subfamily IA, variant 3 [Thermanaerovibrio acidaminovorans DSM 6589]|uniref:HAD-superfamily hydrolase, subfamily IA, variant 3 n=1 Tax=Thermanaerovibrio acidaminovorans (strain ATCC 49978 / DSM 6589 / Su883) TaxID=525903 RepID=D1B657_THEAS|nr:HAD family hydrolase [Thermanaerovibrio acidaminovorans]ACZ19498.1 HAD-superfamily hydrolase, subfamily IA, variant 3 [Thermanaerovibrio acidaminovorans DSM 6589]
MKAKFDLSPRGVVFDFDMTLVDSSHAVTHCLNLLAEDEGLRPITHQDLMGTIGLPFDLSLRRLFGGYDPRWVEAYRSRYRHLEHSMIRPIEGALAALEALKAMGLRLGVVSNRNMVGVVAQRMGLMELLDVAIGLESGLPAKPEPDMLLEALSRMGISPEEALYVGDTDVDMECALRAKVVPVGVATGPFRPEELQSAGARLVLGSVADLPGTIGPLVKVG